MEYSFRWPNLIRDGDMAGNEHVNVIKPFNSFAVLFRQLGCFVLLWVAGFLPAVAEVTQESANSDLFSIAELQNTLANSRRVIRSFRLEGTVCAISTGRNILVLRDASASVLLELPAISSTVHVGDSLCVEGKRCSLVQTRYGIQVGMAAVIENDGVHATVERSGTVFLEQGMNPVRLEWFNALGELALSLDYEGPNLPRQKVPAGILWHGLAGENNPGDIKQGVHFAAYQGNDWSLLPDFSRLKPVAEGAATNFSALYRTRNENCGLVFDGFIQVVQTGLYTFHLAADDGARLYAGKPAVSCKVVASPGDPVPVPENFEQALADRGNHHWVEVEGEIAFAGENQRRLEIELVVGSRHVPVTVVEGAALFSTNLLHRWVRMNGICEFARDSADQKLVGIFVPDAGQVKIYNSAESARGGSGNTLLTTAAQVRRLKPEEAGRHIRSRIRGIVIYAISEAMVLQDSSGGIYISARARLWPEMPHLGELWEIEGTTDRGDFSPVITADTAKFLGNMALPEPIRPTRDQLMNGNLDAEYGELHGVIITISDAEITLLTPDGKITVKGNKDRPLPQLPPAVAGGGSLVGSVVRMRGCFAPLVDLQTRQVVPGQLYLFPALVEIEDPSPLDPFSLPTRKAVDLRWFDAHARALQRTKLAGQIIYASAGEYFVLDGAAGFKVLANYLPRFRAGDLIEAVGFPDLGGSSPVLQEAQIRKNGHAMLPDPTKVSSDKLFDQKHDSTLVQIEAILINDSANQDERLLELQSGPLHFLARLKSASRAWTLLPAGCRLQLTGAYASADKGHMGSSLAPFELLLNYPADIVVLQQPSWWTVRRAVTVIAALVGALGITFVWVALLRRKVEQRTAQLKKEIEERQLVEQHHAIEQERTRVAQDLHDELGAGLTEVSMLGSLANTPAIPPEAKDRYLDQLTHMARSLVTSLDEIVWAVNPHYDSAASLASYFSLFAQRFLNLSGIACRLQVSSDIPECPLDSKVRHGFFCAFKEALNNVIRHSGATEVQLVFKVENDQLVLSVIDNGRGFESAGAVPGKDGLAGMCQRMQQLGGNCRIASQSGQGTKVEFRLPLKKIQYGQNRNR